MEIKTHEICEGTELFRLLFKKLWCLKAVKKMWLISVWLTTSMHLNAKII